MEKAEAGSLEKQLQEALQRLNAHMDNSPLAVIEFDPQFRVIRWSRAAESIFGWKAEEIIGRSISQMKWVYEEDADLVNRVSADFISGKTPVLKNTNRNYRKDGSVICCEWYNSAIYDASGQLTSVLAQVLDITSQTRAEEELRQSERRFQLALKNAPVSVAAQDLNLRFIWAYNQRTVQSPDVIGKTDSDLFPPEDAAKLMALKQKVIATGKDLREELWVNSGGKRVYLNLYLEPIKDQAGKISGIGMATVDLTAMKLADDASREVGARYRNLIETMTEGFALHEIVVDSRGNPCDYRFLEINPAFEELTGLSPAIVGKTIKEVLPDIEAFWIENYGRVALKGESTHFENQAASLGKWYEVYAYSPQRGQFVTLFRDITDRKNAEEEVKQRTVELQAANRELEAFSYSVSHDLRAPLRALDGFSQVLLEDYSSVLDEKGREYLHLIRSSSQTMAHLIDDILNLSRLGRAEIVLELVNLSRLAEESISDLKRANPDREIGFQVQPGLTARGDRRLLKVVFDNLLGNAVKFTSQTSQARIEFGADRAGSEMVFYVQDNGVGFDMNYVDRLFKPFQRLHSNAVYPGTGIGLASVRRIVNRLGGRVWAKAEAGKGAIFYFTLRAD